MHTRTAASRDLSLQRVLPAGRLVGADELAVRTACHDWQQCRSGDLFVALFDGDRDTHHDAARAVARGATGLLVERLLPLPVPQYIVPDTREAYARLSMALVGSPHESMTVIGVTGTCGKTSTVALIESILRHAGRNVAALADPLEIDAAGRARPRQIAIATTMAELRERGTTEVVMEISSRSLATRDVAGLSFDVGVCTNLHRAHLAWHGNAVNYRRAKTRLLEQLKPQAQLLVNGNDRFARKLASRSEHPVLYFGMGGDTELWAEVIERHPGEQTFLLNIGVDTFVVCTRIAGDGHIDNCLAATAAALSLGIDPLTIVKGLERVETIAGRLELLPGDEPCHVVVDVADSADALAGALKALRPITRGTLHCLVSGRHELDPKEYAALGRVAERYADHSVVTRHGKDRSPQRSPFPESHWMLDGFERLAKARVLPSRDAAIEWMLREARPGDTLLVAGHPDPMTTPAASFEERKHIDDIRHQLVSEVGTFRTIRFPMASLN